jgi:hypothetical protein
VRITGEAMSVMDEVEGMGIAIGSCRAILDWPGLSHVLRLVSLRVMLAPRGVDHPLDALAQWVGVDTKALRAEILQRDGPLGLFKRADGVLVVEPTDRFHNPELYAAMERRS